jgi:tRNA-Thr(GGU) m(6)t(6)A37 methyltransferase TsaA
MLWRIMAYLLEIIGTIRSCFGEKFGIPRQPGLAPDARAVLELKAPHSREEYLQGLEAYSHLWVLYIFHATAAPTGKTTVRPPRLGGNRRLGVFATRSNYRPNPVGLSVCELERIEFVQGQGRLHLKGVDILDRTPVIDIKPYLPYADAHPAAQAGWAQEPPSPRFRVRFAPAAEALLASLVPARREVLRRLIVQVLGLDPRPAYYRERATRSCFGMRLDGYDVRWEVRAEGVRVNALVPVPPDDRG